MVWWYWMVLGLILLGAEMTTPGGFYILFFGLSALLVGALAGLDIVLMEWMQWLLFSVIAIGSLLVFRGPLLARINDGRTSHANIDSMIGEVAVALEPLPAGGTGKAELRGSTWTTKNVGPTAFDKGQRGRVTKVDGFTLWIIAE